MDRRRTAVAAAVVMVTLAGCAPARPAARSTAAPAASVETESAGESFGTSASPADPIAALTPDPSWATRHPAPYSWAKQGTLIAHGLGGVDGKRVTNSFEAFKANYDKGYRVFEVDLVTTTDGRLVARHDWEASTYQFLGQQASNPYERLSYKAFKALPIHNAYTPLGIEDIVTIMKAYPDTWFLTDTKGRTRAEVVASMQAIQRAIGPDAQLAERFIIQIYDEPMLGYVRGVHDFKNIVYALYQLQGTKEDAVSFAAAKGIKVVAIPDTMWAPALVSGITGRGLVCAVHTVDDPAIAAKMADSGVGMLYSDFLVPGTH